MAGRSDGTDDSDLRSRSNFQGKLQQFLFNDNHFFEMARTDNSPNIRTNAHIQKRSHKVDHPMTFKSADAYLTTKLRVYETFTIYLELKTTQPDGLILFSWKPEGDFMALELMNGQVHFTFDVGSGARVVKLKDNVVVNDNAWHKIMVSRPTLGKHLLRVDEKVELDHLPDNSAIHFDMNGVFYVGGVQKSMYDHLPKKIHSAQGFQGCVGSLDLNGDSRDILERQGSDIPDNYREDVVAGCEGRWCRH